MFNHGLRSTKVFEPTRWRRSSPAAHQSSHSHKRVAGSKTCWLLF